MKFPYDSGLEMDVCKTWFALVFWHNVFFHTYGEIKYVNDHIFDITPLKFNMEPENGGLEDNFPFQLGDS